MTGASGIRLQWAFELGPARAPQENLSLGELAQSIVERSNRKHARLTREAESFYGQVSGLSSLFSDISPARLLLRSSAAGFSWVVDKLGSPSSLGVSSIRAGTSMFWGAVGYLRAKAAARSEAEENFRKKFIDPIFNRGPFGTMQQKLGEWF